MVMELIRDQGFREQRGEYGSRVGGGDSLDVSILKYFDFASPTQRFEVNFCFPSFRFLSHGLP